MLFTGLLPRARSVCFLIQEHLSRVSPPPVVLPTFNHSEENTPRTCVLTNLMEAIPQLTIPLPGRLCLYEINFLKQSSQHTYVLSQGYQDVKMIIDKQHES